MEWINKSRLFGIIINIWQVDNNRPMKYMTTSKLHNILILFEMYTFLDKIMRKEDLGKKFMIIFKKLIEKCKYWCRMETNI
jgi:hypothetical protein